MANLQEYVGENYQEKFQLLYSETVPKSLEHFQISGMGRISRERRSMKGNFLKSVCSLPSALMSQTACVATVPVKLPVLLNECMT